MGLLNIRNCIKENVYNSKVIVINNILGLIVNDKEINDGVYRERLDNIILIMELNINVI